MVSAKEALDITGIDMNNVFKRKNYYDNLMPENFVVGSPFWFNENKRYAIAPEGYYWKALYNKEDKIRVTNPKDSHCPLDMVMVS